jgi:hypothetical protein
LHLWERTVQKVLRYADRRYGGVFETEKKYPGVQNVRKVQLSNMREKGSEPNGTELSITHL